MKTFRHILIVAGLFVCLSAAQAQDNKLIEGGLNAEKLGLNDLAQSYYQQAIDANNEDTLAHYHMGLLLEKRLRYAQAANMFRITIGLCDTTNPSSTLASSYEHLAFNLIQQNLYEDELLPIIEKAIELNPKSASAYCSMALLVCHQKNYTGALSWAKKAVEADAKSPRAYNTLGVIHFNRGNDNDAIAQFRKAIQVDPDNNDAYYNLGVMYVLRNNYESAITQLKKGLQRDPKSLRLYYYLGVAYIQKEDTPKAIACYEHIINNLDSLYTPAYNRLGAIYCGKGEYDRAVAYHQKAARIDPQDAESYKCLGKVYTDRGDYPKALRSYQKAVQINDKDHETYCLIAKLYKKQNNAARETSSYKKAAKLGNKEAQQWMAARGMAW